MLYERRPIGHMTNVTTYDLEARILRGTTGALVWLQDLQSRNSAKIQFISIPTHEPEKFAPGEKSSCTFSKNFEKNRLKNLDNYSLAPNSEKCTHSVVVQEMTS